MDEQVHVGGDQRRLVLRATRDAHSSISNSSERPQLAGDVFVERQRRAHVGIVMHPKLGSKMQAKTRGGR